MLMLRAGDAVAEIDPEKGGRLMRLAVGDIELLTERASFVMAPYAGRTGYGRFEFAGQTYALPVTKPPHAIHGPVRDRPWVVEEADPLRAWISTDLGPDWPWPGRCEQVLALFPDRIELEASVHADADAFPAALGWHPWFRKPAAVELRAASLLERGDDGLPTGHRISPPPADGPFDDCFEGIDWPVTLTFGSGLVLEVDATGCDHCVFFDEPPDATCVEPQTAPPNALVTGEATIVTPDAPLRATTTWRWTAP